ncbi:MAG: hypothetical protein HYS13_04240 [Planctomycetia bacterium]|nr:hypothetical protein [Planctomycetia bacterium]
MPAILDIENDPAGQAAFLALPEEVYAGDGHYCASSRQSVWNGVRREKFRGRQRILVAMKGNRYVARAVARVSPTLKDKSGKPIGMIGFFEALREADAVHELLTAAVKFLRDFGAGQIAGPMDGDTWHKYRFNLGPFDRPPFLMEPYNKPYYAELWEEFGFKTLETYHSQHVADVPPVIDKMDHVRRHALEAGYTIRSLVKRRFQDELRLLYGLSRRIFAGNFLYEPIEWDDFAALYEPVRSLIEEDLVLFAEAPGGEPAGFLFAVRDYHAAAQAMCGRTGLLAKLAFLRQKSRADAVNLKSLGVVPEHRQTGLAGALMCEAYVRIVQRGLRRANLCLIRDGNPSGKLEGGEGVVSRRYGLYELK